ncbi:hypothetical protein MRX96_019772 [Rhipicephalus microplus]
MAQSVEHKTPVKTNFFFLVLEPCLSCRISRLKAPLVRLITSTTNDAHCRKLTILFGAVLFRTVAHLLAGQNSGLRGVTSHDGSSLRVKASRTAASPRPRHHVARSSQVGALRCLPLGCN